VPDLPKVLVSILCYNNAEDTAETIRGFRTQNYLNFELIVIDNHSTTDCVPQLEKLFPDLRIIRLASNTGYTGGNNAALEIGLKEGFDYVLISNHDVTPGEGLLSCLIETAERQNRCGIVGVIEEDYFTGEIRTVGGIGFRFWKARGKWIRKLPEGQTVLKVDYAQGAVLLFSREALVRGIRLDERLFMYCEEIDLSFQLKEKGLEAFTDLRCRVRHKSVPTRFNPFQGYYLQRNRLYLCRKYAPLSVFFLTMLYFSLFELPLKGLVRSLQGHPDYARACWRGFRDGLKGEMGFQWSR
jgi:GT2 family glycosyltransferase